MNNKKVCWTFCLFKKNVCPLPKDVCSNNGCSTKAACSTNVCSEKLFVPYRKMCVRKMIGQQFCLFENVFAPTTICSNNVLRVARVARKVVARDEQPMVMGHAGVSSGEMYRISFAY